MLSSLRSFNFNIFRLAARINMSVAAFVPIGAPMGFTVNPYREPAGQYETHEPDTTLFTALTFGAPSCDKLACTLIMSYGTVLECLVKDTIKTPLVGATYMAR